MRRRFSTQQEEAEINLTPMLDIVFIMLIFFIVTATFVKEYGIDLTKDDSQQENQPVNPPPTIYFRVTDSGQIWNDDRLVDIRRVGAVIQQKLSKNADSPVLVYAQEDARNEHVIAVIDAALAAGVAKEAISFKIEGQ